MTAADLNFYFDPVCPFAWMTSTWVRQVQAQRQYTVDWRTIALRQVNADVDYEGQFPPAYEAGHTAGLRLIRLVHAARAAHGREVVGPLYEALGRAIFDTPPSTDEQVGPDGLDVRGTSDFVAPILSEVGLPTHLVSALDDESLDVDIQAETDEALSLTGKDVGTPIIHFSPPDGMAFFGPVISRRPSDEDAVKLWDNVSALAAFPGFAEIKRSLRERPQLAAFGVAAGDVGVQEDWRGGSRGTSS